ncbi:MAG: flagellar biosynthesis protein FlhF [Treponema sp.]
MEVFVEQAASYEKCLKKIWAKHGDDVVILRKKASKAAKFFGLLEYDTVEVTFTINESAPKKAYTAASAESEPVAGKVQPPLNDYEEQLKIIQGYAEKNPHAANKLRPYLATIQEKNTMPQEQKADADPSMRNLMEKVALLVAKVEQQQTAPEPEHPHILKIGKLLEENDFGISYIKTLCARLKSELSYTEIENFQIVQEKLFAILVESIKTLPPSPKEKTRIISVVGTTGVGKTTTLAKVAAHYVLAGEKVRVITLDIWRIGGVPQMERYCEVMEVELTVSSNPTEFRACLDIYREETDVICIDTTGRSPKDRAKLLEMRDFFTGIDENAEIYLAICAGTRVNDIREIMKQYELFKYKSLIITKFDETSYIGNLLTVLAETKIPITYVTTGQKVPQDFMLADAKIFLEKLKGFSVDQEYINYLCGTPAESS